MAPTTPDDFKTSTTPAGRSPANEGHPLRMAELLANFDAVVYSERVAFDSPRGIRQARRAIKKAFQAQIEGRGFSMVEILSPCPTYWHLEPADAMKYIDEVLKKVFPLGVYKDWEK